jgi:HK97 family phage major capsid protein
MNLAELRGRLEAIEAERRGIHETAGDAALNDDQQTRWDALDTEETSVREGIAQAEENEARAARVAESRARWGSVNVQSRDTAFAPINGGPAATRQQLVSSLIRANEHRDIDPENQRHFERILNRHAGDRAWAENLLGRSRPEYESGFAKLMMGRSELLTNEERTAMSVGSNTNGGYLLPTHLDPTLILTNAGSSNAIRGISRVVTLGGGETVWHGGLHGRRHGLVGRRACRGFGRHPHSGLRVDRDQCGPGVRAGLDRGVPGHREPDQRRDDAVRGRP